MTDVIDDDYNFGFSDSIDQPDYNITEYYSELSR